MSEIIYRKINENELNTEIFSNFYKNLRGFYEYRIK